MKISRFKDNWFTLIKFQYLGTNLYIRDVININRNDNAFSSKNIYILRTFKLKYGEYDVIFNGSVKIMINPKISDDHIKRFLKMV